MQKPIIGEARIELESVDSTNKYAADRLGLPELQHGTVILANEQTAGRGQRSRTWISVKGQDLTFSLVLRPTGLKASAQFMLAKVAALAVHGAVSQALRKVAGLGGCEVRIKWPNDILIGSRKVAGILIQNDLAGDRVTACIVGIGLNVNSAKLHTGLGSTSLRAEAGHQLDRKVLLDDVLARFQQWWDLAERDPKALDRAYAEELWGREQPMAMELDAKSFKAIPLDVDETGRLIVRDTQGEKHAYGLDRLRFVARFQ